MFIHSFNHSTNTCQETQGVLCPGNTGLGEEEDRLGGGRTNDGLPLTHPTFAHQALSEARGRGVGDFLQVPKAHPALLGGGLTEKA